MQKKLLQVNRKCTSCNSTRKASSFSRIKKNVAELSIGIAESVIKKELSNKKDQLELVEGILKDVTLN